LSKVIGFLGFPEKSQQKKPILSLSLSPNDNSASLTLLTQKSAAAFFAVGWIASLEVFP